MAEPALRGTFGRPFAEQVAAFRLRQADLVPTRAWDDLRHARHDRAFVVAGAMKAELLADLAEAVRRGIEDGTSLEAFRRDFRRIVERHGWHGWTGEGTAKGEAWRTRVIYQTNMRTSYMAGRRAQLEQGGYRFWVYRHSNAREPRLHHLAWDGLALPPDHPLWATHYPPNGWGCGCRVFGARSEAGIRRMGGDPDKRLPEGWDAADPRTGAPKGIDKGWDYAPGASVAEAVTPVRARLPTLPPEIARGLLEELLPRLPAPQGARLAETVRPEPSRRWAEWLAEARAGRDGPGFVGAIGPSVIKALDEAGRMPSSADVWIRPAVVRGPKRRRHEAAGDAMPDPYLDRLPELLHDPVAVLLEVRTGNLLLVLSREGDRRPRVVVRGEFPMRVERRSTPRNVIVSASQPRLDDLRGRLKGGDLALLSGSLE